MKTLQHRLIWLFILARAAGCIHAQDLMPEWKATLTVFDEERKPVADAEARIWYHIRPAQGQTIAMTNKVGLTDSNGIFYASEHSTTIELIYEATKSGYYNSGRSYELGLPIQYDPVKWSPHLTLVLKKIGKPVPMYAKRLNTHIPAVDNPAGFDLVVGDWTSPYGKGTSTDFVFTGHFEKHAEGESDYALTVSFPNKGDGIMEFTSPAVEKGSGLRSPHEAPADGYQSKWVQFDNRKPGKPVETNHDENRNFFFRVRTTLDEKGNVKSALYGKIYGDFMQFTYYLNPTPNDRNIEFDPKHNLMQGLKSFEQVTAP